MEQVNLLPWLSWKGRINRLPYLLTNLMLGVVSKALEGVSANDSMSVAEALGWLLFAVLVLYLAIIVSIKRAHDRGRSGYYLFLMAVPILNLWPIIELGFFRGTHGHNKFGEDPLEEPKTDAGSTKQAATSDVSPREVSSVVGDVAMKKVSQGD